ncbi:MAG: peptidase domain-containing ABC transporter [Bacteroidota bacterium]
MSSKSFPFCKQLDSQDCGPSCLRMIAKHYGRKYSLEFLREKSHVSRQGISMMGISDTAESIGFRTMGVKLTFAQLMHEATLPCIVHWKQKHFVVVYKIKPGKKNGAEVYIADPAHGLLKYSNTEFLKGWISTATNKEEKGIAMLFEPSPEFYAKDDDEPSRTSFSFLSKYFKPYRKYIAQLVIGLLLGSLLQLLFPFLTQAVVDIGIGNRNMNFIYLVLAAQLMLFFSRAFVEFIRSWILLHIGARINISLISDFLIKLMKLPVGFFDTKMTGDLLQRINDNHRIETFLTSSSVSVLFSAFSLLMLSVVLAIYSLPILFLFLAGSTLYVLWIWRFMRRRRSLDYKRFTHLAENQGKLYQMITGIQEIKLNNCEKRKRWEWEQIQARLFSVNIKSLKLTQNQLAGSVFINEIKNIIICFLAARAVLDGSMTLGMMLAVQYIIGQMNSPIDQMINFIHTAQDAKISLERLSEIHNKTDEEITERGKITELPADKSISITDVSFQYEGHHSAFVLKNISMDIPESKVTAIVGMSGSGKTTLIKLLLGFYPPTKGEIYIGGNKFENYNNRRWRDNVGVVMQDGFIFSDSIARNIAVNDDSIDREKLLSACEIANIRCFTESLPLGFNTKIGQEGVHISQGQKQRILIARAVYKDPQYLFLDEATNSLDTNNEKIIHDNLRGFFKRRTVVIVAHRLSTVKDADQIIVLDNGEIVEIGLHEELRKKKGTYFSLVRNQLELGN